MPKLIFHDLKSTQKKTSIYSKNNERAGEEIANRVKPVKPQVKCLKYVDLVITWRRKTAEAKTLACREAWGRKEEEEEENNVYAADLLQS